MKTLLFLGAFGLFVGYLYAEFCADGQASSCTLTVCGNNTKIDCHRDDDANMNVCTCVPTADHQCTETNEQMNDEHECDKYGDCHRHGNHWHCVQGTCRCYSNSHGHSHDG